MTYILVYLFCLVAVVASLSLGKGAARSIVYYVTLLGLFLFTAFRQEVGCDFTQYGVLFDLYSSESFSFVATRVEPGFYALIILLNRLGISYTGLNFISSGIFFLGLHLLARRQRLPIAFLVLAFPILIVNMPMSAVRQSIALGFMFMALLAFSDKKLKMYISLVFTAFLFHTSAIVFLALWPLVNREINFKNCLISIALALPAAVVMYQLEGTTAGFARHLDVESATAFGAPFRLGLLFIVGVAFFTYFKRKWLLNFENDYRLVYLFSGLMLILPGIYFLFFVVESFLGSQFMLSVIGDRFGYYLMPVQLIILIRMSYFLRSGSRKYLNIAPYAVGLLVLLVWTQTSFIYERCYSPYMFGLS